jgi:hypothetical protein
MSVILRLLIALLAMNLAGILSALQLQLSEILPQNNVEDTSKRQIYKKNINIEIVFIVKVKEEMLFFFEKQTHRKPTLKR